MLGTDRQAALVLCALAVMLKERSLLVYMLASCTWRSNMLSMVSKACCDALYGTDIVQCADANAGGVCAAA